jgi:alkylation response protein AidB-like acyl-CoA dehydrogenase
METPLFDQWRARSPHYDESHEAVCDTVRAFVAKEITPHVDEWEAAGQLPRELHRKAAEAGVLGLNYPEEFGGMMQQSVFMSTKLLSAKFLGSTTAEWTLVNTLNSSATRAS